MTLKEIDYQLSLELVAQEKLLAKFQYARELCSQARSLHKALSKELGPELVYQERRISALKRKRTELLYENAKSA
jgi:hypothetical protein